MYWKTFRGFVVYKRLTGMSTDFILPCRHGKNLLCSRKATLFLDNLRVHVTAWISIWAVLCH